MKQKLKMEEVKVFLLNSIDLLNAKNSENSKVLDEMKKYIIDNI